LFGVALGIVVNPLVDVMDVGEVVSALHPDKNIERQIKVTIADINDFFCIVLPPIKRERIIIKTYAPI
jgi:hypothetical protein